MQRRHATRKASKLRIVPQIHRKGNKRNSRGRASRMREGIGDVRGNSRGPLTNSSGILKLSETPSSKSDEELRDSHSVTARCEVVPKFVHHHREEQSKDKGEDSDELH